MPIGGRGNPGLGSGPPRYTGSFLLAFRDGLARIRWQMQRLVGDIAYCADAEGREHVVGVENLYRRCRRSPRETWHELVDDFLRTVQDVEQSENVPADLERVATQLLPRIGHPIFLGPEQVKVWHHPLVANDLVTNLVIDYPDRMCYVTEPLVADSGRPGADWLEQAKANLLARTPADCIRVIHDESGMRACGVGDAYDSSRALLMDRLLPEFSKSGYLLIVPGRDELLILPVTAQAIPHIHLMKVLAEKNFRTAPYPISDEVFWLHEGTWHRFPIALQSQEVTVQPPAAFVEVLSRLTAPGD